MQEEINNIRLQHSNNIYTSYLPITHLSVFLYANEGWACHKYANEWKEFGKFWAGLMKERLAVGRLILQCQEWLSLMVFYL